MKNALIIFAKNPIKGKVKSRLAKTIGKDKAFKVYTKLLSLTYNHTKNLKPDKYLYLTKSIDDSLFDTSYVKKLQEGSNLGKRMLNSFKELFDSDYKKIVLVGTDIPSLTEKIIKESFEKLNTFDIVIGPSKDGGYYLIGLKKPLDLFSGMTWGNKHVLHETIKRIKEYNKSYCLIKELIDIDDEKDLEFMNY